MGKELREKAEVDHEQVSHEDEEINIPPPAGNELAKQETLGEEQGLGEKPPW